MKRDRIIIFGVILIVFISIIGVNLFKNSKGKNNLEELPNNSSSMAILIEQEDGTYSESDTFPTEGYEYDNKRSGCVDKDGNRINKSNLISYNSSNNVLTVSNNETTNCYIYFNKK